MSTRATGYSLLVVSACISFLGAGWFLVLPLLTQQSSLQQDIVRLNSGFDQAKKAGVTRLDQDKLTQLKQDSDTLIPSVDAQYDLIIQLEALSRSIGITYQTLTVTPVQSTAAVGVISPGSAKRLNIAITAVLSYDKLQELLAQLPTVQRFVQIDQINVSGSGSSSITPGSSGNLSLQLQGSAYYLP